jgi:rubrerythrin
MYAAIRAYNTYTGKWGLWFVPTVMWTCGHTGFALDWTQPGPCPQCGEPTFDHVSTKEPDDEYRV